MEQLGVVVGENIQVESSGSNYEEAVTQACKRLMEIIDRDEPVGRTEESLIDNWGWYVAATFGCLSPGGTTLELTVCFRRKYA